jgi:hypothetical protein
VSEDGHGTSPTEGEYLYHQKITHSSNREVKVMLDVLINKAKLSLSVNIIPIAYSLDNMKPKPFSMHKSYSNSTLSMPGQPQNRAG